MLVAELTPYGQSVVSTHVTIDGIILLSEYLLNIDSLTNISSYTTLLDEDACGNISKSNGYVKVLDTSESVYQARTLLFYSLSGSTKNIVAGCSQSDPIVNKTSSALNIQVPVDLSCFTNGFIFSSIQSGYHTASDNIDGVVHIDDPSLDSDDTYSVYSKPQVDTLLSNKQSSLEAGDGISLSDNIVRTTGIPFGICDSTSTATKFTVTVPGIYKLEDGVTCMVKNGVVTSASGFTLNVNGLGAKPCYTNLAAATRDTTIFNVAYTMLFVYDSTRVSGGCWICYRGYDSNTNTVGYQLRTNSTIMNVSDTARYYKLYFTSADGNLWVPASVNSTNDTTTARAVNQRPINPFGRIVYTSANTNYATGANLAATTIWDQYNLALGYSFNVNGGTLALTAEKPVYVKCAPQTDGSAIIDAANPTVQDLPTSNDGKIYIFLGAATSATAVELFQNHPVYYHDGNGIKLWSGVVLPSKTSDLTNDSGFITEEDIPTNVSAFNNDAGYLTTYTETDPTVPSWAKQATKPTYNLDEVADGSTRKLSNYVPTTRKVNNKVLSSDVTLTLDNIADGTTRSIPTVNNSTITIKKNSDDTGDSFTTNTASGKTINLGLSTVASSGSYNDLSNKPTIPTVNNATLTIQKNGTTIKTFTANASSNVTANITVPTTVAELSDAGSYATTSSLSSLVASAQYNSTTKKIEFYNSSSTKLNTDIDASDFIKDGMVDTVEVSGGNLVITFNTDAGKEDIEIPISDIFDANNYYTKTQVDGLIPTVNNAKLTIKKNASDTGTEFTANASTNVTCNLGLATVATSGSYNDLSNKPTIPTVNDTTVTIKKNASDAGDSFTTNTATAKTINLGLSTVATSGSYNDLSNKPTIHTVNNSTITIKKNSGDTGDSFTTNASSGKTINLGLATVATSGSYNDLSNKPTIPTVNNATLTIQKNGTTVKTFTANASSNVTANITVPLESISVDGATQTITNGNVDLHIPDDIYSSDFICSMTRTNVSGSGNLTLSGTVGPFPVSGTPMPAGTYRVRIRMRSTTSSYSLTVNFGGSYTLTSSNGVIDDIRSVTLSSASTFSASVTQVNANTYIKVGIYEPDVIVTDIGDAAVTNDYNDLDNIPNGTLIIQKNGSNVASFSASATSNVTANITVPTDTNDLTNGAGYLTQHQQIKTINNQSLIGTGNISIESGGGEDNIIESISINNTAQPITNKNVNLTQPTTIDGVSFNTSTNLLHYTTCATAAGTAAKVVNLEGFTLVEGARVTVKFSATNSASNPTLNVNNTGAKAIKYRGTSAVTSSNWYRWQAGDIIDFIYDGTNWLMVGWQTYATNASVASYASYVGNSSANYVAYSNNTASNGKALLPYADASDSTKYVDLGSTAKKWRDLYVDRNAYFGRNGNASVYGNNYNNDLVIKSTGDTGDSTLGNQTSLLTLNPNYLWLRFENSSESNNVITVQKFENGSTGSRVFVDTDYIFLENGAKIDFEYQSSAAASIGRISSRTIDLNNEQVTVPDLELRLNDANSRFIINSSWLEVAYFDRKGLTIKSQSAINNDTCEAIKLTSSETVFNKDVSLVLAKDTNTYVYAGDELHGDDYRHWWTNYDQESMSYTSISISMTEETSADSTLEVPIDALSSVTPFGKLIVNTTSSSLGIGTTSVTDSLKSLIESGRINTVENYVFLCFDSSNFPSNIIGVVICAELLTTSEKLMFFIPSNDLELVGYQHNPSQGPYFIVNSLGSGSYSLSNDYNFNYRIIAKTSIKDYVDDKIDSRIDQGVTQAEYSTYASQVGIIGANSNTSYPLLFTSSVTSSPYDSIYNNIYTDTSNDIYYNPSANTLTCQNFDGNLTGNADTATKATKDSDGNIITSYYCTLSTDQTVTGNKTFIANVYITTSSSSNNLYVTGYSDGCGIRLGDSTSSTAYPMIVGETHTGSSCDLRQNYYVDNTLKGTIQTNCDSSGNLVTTSKIGRSTVTTGKWSLGDSNSYLKEIYVNDLHVNSDIIPSSSMTYDLGSTTYLWDHIYASEFVSYGDKSSYPNHYVRFYADNGTSIGATRVSSITNYTINNNQAVFYLITEVNTNSSYALTSAITKPKSTNVWSLGTSSLALKEIYVSGSNSSYMAVLGNSGNSSYTYPTLRPTTSGYGYLGLPSYKWSSIYVNSIGSSSARVSSAYVDSLYVTSNGTLLSTYISNQTASTISGTGIGSIRLFCVLVAASTTTTYSITYGTTFDSSGIKDSGGVTRTISFASMASSWNNDNSVGFIRCFSQSGTISGTWKVLHQAYMYNTNTAHGVNVPILAIRTA